MAENAGGGLRFFVPGTAGDAHKKYDGDGLSGSCRSSNTKKSLKKAD
jgi:hypothetical protein